MLHDFVREFQYAPTFARNFVYESMLTFLNTNSSGTQLFEYMLKHHGISNMRKIKMHVDCDEEIETVCNNRKNFDTYLTIIIFCSETSQAVFLDRLFFNFLHDLSYEAFIIVN